MKKLTIKWTHDTHYCESCGTMWADGAVAELDGVEFYNKPAVAHCMNPLHTSEEDIHLALLKYLGIEVVNKKAGE